MRIFLSFAIPIQSRPAISLVSFFFFAFSVAFMCVLHVPGRFFFAVAYVHGHGIPHGCLLCHPSSASFLCVMFFHVFVHKLQVIPVCIFFLLLLVHNASFPLVCIMFLHFFMCALSLSLSWMLSGIHKHHSQSGLDLMSSSFHVHFRGPCAPLFPLSQTDVDVHTLTDTPH